MFYVILTISYLRAQTIETSSLPTDSSRPLFKQIKIFSSILTVYLNCKYCPYYTRELLGCLLGISPSWRNPCGGKNQNYLPWPLNQSNLGANTRGQCQTREKPCTIKSHLTSDWLRKWQTNLSAHHKEK